MHRLAAIWLGVLTTAGLSSQVILERSVIGAAGGEGSGSFHLEFTAGEPITETIGSDNRTLTQGFHQPTHIGELTVSFFVTPPCGSGANGRVVITAIEGCDGGDVHIFWNGEEGGAEFGALGPELLQLLVETSTGCSYETTIETDASVASALCQLRLYNLITPNGDGANDRWVIDFIETVPGNRVTILNRRGQRIWEGADYNNADIVWDGNDQRGRPLPNGTYFYLVEARGERIRGFVELLR
jgi:gliding motility-associated-like protein